MLSGVTSQLTRIAFEGGRLNWQAVAADALSTALFASNQNVVEQQRAAMGNTAGLHDGIKLSADQMPQSWNSIGSVPELDSPTSYGFTAEDFANFRLNTVIESGILASQTMQTTYAVDNAQFRGFKLFDGVYRPGVNDAQLIPVAEIGGHFAEPQLLGQAFVGVYSPVLGREFTQQDLNDIVAYSQLPDQVRYFDALAAGLRYANPFSGNFLGSDMRLVQESLHSLNQHGIDFNIDRSLAVVQENPGNWAVAGMALHPLVDAVPHAGYAGIPGHIEPSLKGDSPDYMSSQLAVATAPSVLQFFETLTGISASTVLPGRTASVYSISTGILNLALAEAGADGATGIKFEQQFNLAAQNLLPAEALKLPTLSKVTGQWAFRQSWDTAVEQTWTYLGQIGLQKNPDSFLNDAFDAYILIANKYLENPRVHGTLYDGTHMQPIDREHVVPNPLPVRQSPTFLPISI